MSSSELSIKSDLQEIVVGCLPLLILLPCASNFIGALQILVDCFPLEKTL